MHMDRLKKRGRQFEKASMLMLETLGILFLSNEILFFSDPDKVFLRYPDGKVAMVFHVIVLLYLVLGAVSVAYRVAARCLQKQGR